jgi:hypothetical protein
VVGGRDSGGELGGELAHRLGEIEVVAQADKFDRVAMRAAAEAMKKALVVAHRE